MIDIQTIGIDSILLRLKKMINGFKDLSPALFNIRERLLMSVEENFLEGGRYKSGKSFEGGDTKWKKLSKATIKERTKRGDWPGQILVESGILKQSISGSVTENSVTIGTNVEYAAIQQFGGMAGRGKKVKIPARPFLVIQDDDVEEIRKIVAKQINF